MTRTSTTGARTISWLCAVEPAALRTGIAILLILSATAAANAQNAPDDPRTRPVAADDLARRIGQLEARVKDLEALLARTTATTQAPTTPAVAEPPASAETAPDAMMGGGDETSPKLRLRGFGDVEAHTSNRPDDRFSFGLGQFDLFITSRLSERISFLSEMVLEANLENAFGFEIERAMLQYSVNEHLNIGMGRYHTAIGYYNTTYHHGSWFATAIDRPFVFAFEDQGGILPVHNVGVTVNGKILSDGGLRYVAEVGNGRAVRSAGELVQNRIDENPGKAFNVALELQPPGVPGLRTGASFYRDRLTPIQVAPITESIGAGYVAYETPTVELIGEALMVRHAPKAFGSTFTTRASYVQASRHFGRSRPYFRYQYLGIPDNEPLFTEAQQRNGPSIGWRFDIGPFAALKAQYDRNKRRAASATHGFAVQLSFAF
jgi:hypothetical protein